MRLRTNRAFVILLMVASLTFASLADGQTLGCKYDCTQGVDTASCWEYLSGNGNMNNCQAQCDCMGWYCYCWCTGDRCFNV
jgi:hypothetical protein